MSSSSNHSDSETVKIHTNHLCAKRSKNKIMTCRKIKVPQVDTESVWNRLSDADKRDAIRYARLYVQQVPDAAKREWPSRFISTRPWT